MTDKNSHADDVRRTEALYRFGAALPARDDVDENLYHEWRERDARRPPDRATYGCSPHLRSLTPAQLRLLAEADLQAQAEYAVELEAEAEAEAEAGF